MSEVDKKKNLPKRQFNFYEKINKNPEKVFLLDVSAIGSVNLRTWTWGQGTNDEISINHREVKKLRDWLTKIIDFTERK